MIVFYYFIINLLYYYNIEYAIKIINNVNIDNIFILFQF